MDVTTPLSPLWLVVTPSPSPLWCTAIAAAKYFGLCGQISSSELHRTYFQSIYFALHGFVLCQRFLHTVFCVQLWVLPLVYVPETKACTFIVVPQPLRLLEGRKRAQFLHHKIKLGCIQSSQTPITSVCQAWVRGKQNVWTYFLHRSSETKLDLETQFSANKD